MRGNASARRGLALLGALVAVAMLAMARGQAAGPAGLPPGPGRDLVLGSCQTCHSLNYLTESKGISRSQWDGLLSAMQQYGLQVTPANRKAMLDYLATYLGPKPPPKPAAETAAAQKIDPEALFAAQCAGCHQAKGQGVPGSFPPLAGNRDLFLDRAFPARVLLHGMAGKIAVGGSSYDGAMPAFAYLSDAQIAALVTYIRGSWGNAAQRPADMTPVDPGTVKALRDKAMTPQEVHAARAALEAQAKGR